MHQFVFLLLSLLVQSNLLFKLALVHFHGLIPQVPPDVILMLHRRHHVFEFLLLFVTVLLHQFDVCANSRMRIVEGIGSLVVFQEAVCVLRGLQVELHGEVFVHVH
jgi:hypothetical protein